MQVEYTNEEAQTAINLYDMAVKSGGLQVANAAIMLTKKLQDASVVKETPVES